MELGRVSLIVRGAALILCAYMILGLLIFAMGDPAEGQSQAPEYVFTAVIFCLSVTLGAIGGRDISSAARVINSQNAAVARRASIALFLGALATAYWSLSSRAPASIGVFALALLAMYLCAGAFVESVREKNLPHS